MAQISLGCLMSKVTVPVVGSIKIHCIVGVIKGAELQLTEEEIIY